MESGMRAAIDKRKELLHMIFPVCTEYVLSMYVLSTSCMIILAKKTAYHLFWNDFSIIIRSLQVE